MQVSPTDNDANGQAEVSLENILAAIQNQSAQTNASIQQLNMGMERLSEKVDYLHQEQVEMESSHEAIREDMEKLRAGKSLFSDITKEAEMNSGEEATEKKCNDSIIGNAKRSTTRSGPTSSRRSPLSVKFRYRTLILFFSQMIKL